MKVLRARLYEAQRSSLAAARGADRKAQVGTGDRSERIRTYNFPQGRVSDHRINLTLHKIDRVILGELDEIVDALTAEDQAARLAADRVTARPGASAGGDPGRRGGISGRQPAMEEPRSGEARLHARLTLHGARIWPDLLR